MNKLDLIVFFSTWNNNCKLYDKVINKIEKEFDQHLNAIKLNIDSEENQEYKSKYNVTYVPHTIILKDSQIQLSRSGIISYLNLTNIINNLL